MAFTFLGSLMRTVRGFRASIGPGIILRRIAAGGGSSGRLSSMRRAHTDSGSQVGSIASDLQEVGGMVTPHKSRWRSSKEWSLTRQAFLDMLDGKIPFIRQPNFISRELAERLEDELSPKLIPYENSTGPPVLKVGLAQFEYQAQTKEDIKRRSKDSREKQRYFVDAKASLNLHAEIAAKVGQDVRANVLNAIASLVPEWDVQVANEGPEKKYFAGIFRAVNQSTPIHSDWSPYDSATEDWILNRVIKQATFNLFLTPAYDGYTVIYDIQWTPQALHYRDPLSYGYSADVVAGQDSCTLRPQLGDLCLFNSRNMHQVFAVGQNHPPARVGLPSHRLTMSSFMGLLPPQGPGQKPKLIFWS